MIGIGSLWDPKVDFGFFGGCCVAEDWALFQAEGLERRDEDLIGTSGVLGGALAALRPAILKFYRTNSIY